MAQFIPFNLSEGVAKLLAHIGKVIASSHAFDKENFKYADVMRDDGVVDLEIHEANKAVKDKAIALIE